MPSFSHPLGHTYIMVMFIPPAYVVYCSLVQYIDYGTWILENVCECYRDMIVMSCKGSTPTEIGNNNPCILCLLYMSLWYRYTCMWQVDIIST